MRSKLAACAVLALLPAAPARAQSAYYRHVLFDNSVPAGRW